MKNRQSTMDPMFTEPGNHVLPDFLLVGLILAPFGIILAILVGVGLYVMGNREAALWICGIALCTSVVLGPIAIWQFSKPHNRIPCECGGTRRR